MELRAVPTLEEYEEAARRYPEPIRASEEEMMRLEQEDEGKVDEIYAARHIR